MSNGGSSSTLQNSMGAMSNAGSGGFSPQTPPYGQGNQQGGFMQGGFGQQGGFQPQGGFGQQGSSPFGGGRPPWMQQQQQTPPWMQQQQQTPPWMQQQQQTPPWMQQQQPSWMQQQPPPWMQQPQTPPWMQPQQQAYGGNSQREMFEQMDRVQSQRAQLQQDMGAQLQNNPAKPAGGQGLYNPTPSDDGPMSMTMDYRPQGGYGRGSRMSDMGPGMGGNSSAGNPLTNAYAPRPTMGMGMRPQPYGYYKKGGKV